MCAAASKPSTLLIYYGYLNSFDSAHLQWNNEKVAQAMSQYSICVFGAGIANPTHPDYANTVIIINRIKEINPSVVIYGYVQTDLPINDFKDQVNLWDNLGVEGIFLDRAGYDFGTNRVDFNNRILHIRSKLSANICFVNAWNQGHVVGIANDPSYPNMTFNPDGYPSLLNNKDIYLLESFAVNTTAYSSGFAAISDWINRGQKASYFRKNNGIRVASVSIFDNTDPNGQSFSDFGYYASMGFGVEFYATATNNFGSDGQVKYWKKPGGAVEIVEPVGIIQDLSNLDKYFRYGKTSKLVITYSNTIHTGQVISYNL